MGSSHNAIGLWLCRYVFIYTLPMPSVLRSPHPPGLPAEVEWYELQVLVVPSSPTSLPRRVVMTAYKFSTSFPHRAPTPTTHTLRPPEHHELQDTHYHNLLRISQTRARVRCKHCHRASAAVETPHARHSRPHSSHSRPATRSIRPSTLLIRYNSTSILHSSQFTRLTPTSSLAALAAGSTFHGTHSRHHLIVDAHHFHHILIFIRVAAFIWTVISCYSNHQSRDRLRRRLQRLFPSLQLPSFYTPLPHHNTTTLPLHLDHNSTLTTNTTPLCTHHSITTSPVRHNHNLLQLGWPHSCKTNLLTTSQQNPHHYHPRPSSWLAPPRSALPTSSRSVRPTADLLLLAPHPTRASLPRPLRLP